jgi:hypothetical protein
MVQYTRKQFQDLVHERLDARAVKEVIEFTKSKAIYFWGEVRPRDVEKDWIMIALFKDLYHVGYTKLALEIKDFVKTSSRAICHNVELARKVMNEWAETVIKLGTVAEWKAISRNCHLTGECKDANLWMDSSDFPIKRFKGYTKKHPSHSFKLNKPGRRYMTLMDGKGIVRKVWGGYSPKLYDGDFLESHKYEIEETFKGAVIADNHVSKGKKLFKKVKFYTNFAEKKSEEREGYNEDFSTSEEVKVKKKFNADHQKVRARVETPYGYLKKKFDSFVEPWESSEQQLDYLVKTALAFRTHKLTH